jgi:hypothetical protein
LATEVPLVQFPVQRLEPMNQPQVTCPGPLPARNLLGRWYVGMDWKIEKLSFRGPADCFRNARVQKPDDGLQNMIGGKPIPPMDPEHASAETQHYRLIGVGEDPLDILEAQRPQPLWQIVFKQKTLPCRPAAPLPRCHSP